MKVNEEDQENYYITCPECRGENQAPNCDKCGGLRKVPRVPEEEVTVSRLLRLLTVMKNCYDSGQTLSSKNYSEIEQLTKESE